MREITQEEFDKKLVNLAKSNSLVRALLSKKQGFGSYQKLPQNIKRLIDEKFRIKRKAYEVMYLENDNKNGE